MAAAYHESNEMAAMVANRTKSAAEEMANVRNQSWLAYNGEAEEMAKE